MTSHYARLVYHIVLVTKFRAPTISPTLEPVLYTALREVFERGGADFVLINGVEDHVHILLKVSACMSLSELVKEAKRASYLIAREYDARFCWSRGFAVFTVSYKHHDELVSYILAQKRHHRLNTARPEYEWLESSHS